MSSYSRIGFVASEGRGLYETHRPVSSEDIVAMANRLIRIKFARGKAITKPTDAAVYLPAQMAGFEHETFWALFLDNQHRILAFEKLFTGTLASASVYPREVVKRSLQLNAAAIIFAHNHPSGTAIPSQSDKDITHKLKEALALIEVNVLDHFIVGGDDVTSLAELGVI
ncbi:MAG: DNA repair protein RadC [Methylomonas sp.]|jgi:DNA repair protein RadC|uniref:JAB domain-containing protein n=1 Tax=Methylomonas sp. TaxID=418 RepID=UPI0025DE2DD2|nr:DNA repair protein RadC [Methylomonas sp.]MCK9608655.1 DNA repair protein RadC [Methylomonas sp.]